MVMTMTTTTTEMIAAVTTSKMSQGQATTGAMLYSLVQAIESNRAYTYGELLFTMRTIIESSLGKGKITYNNNVSDNTNYYGASYHGASRRPENRGMSNALGAKIAAGIGVGIASAMAASWEGRPKFLSCRRVT